MLALSSQLPPRLQLLLQRYQERYARWLLPAVQALLVIAIGWTLARLLWSLVPTPQAAQWRPAPVVASGAAARSASAGVETIVAAKLFGVYQAPTTASALSQAPDTNLNLTLLGILAGSTDLDSRALIGQQNGEEKPYSIGQDIVGGVSLQAIFPDRVILSRNGALETLRLDKNSPNNSTAEPVVQTTASGDAATPQMLSQIREQILGDPSKAGDYIRVQPATASGGGTKGYRVYPGKERTLFSGSGLRPGDLVTSVNGIQLDDGQKALQTLNDLKAAGSITLTIERGGQTQTLNVSLSP